MKRSARETALAVLCACRQSGAWSDGMLKAALRQSGLDARDAALATRLCGGVLQNRLFLDYHLGRCCSQELRHLDPILLDILRLGAYQLLCMDKIPLNAAVNEAVEMAKRHKRSKASGLVNAVLRRLARERESLPDIQAENEEAYLSIRYSHPLWLTRRLLALLGREEAESFLRLNNEAVPTTIGVNSLKTDAAALSQELEATGAALTPHSWLGDCYTLQGAGNLAALPAFLEGRFLVQDAAARASVLAVRPQPGSWVIDLCAAPGGKSFAAAMLMEDTGEILACDIHPHKLTLIETNAQRLGITCLQTVCADARSFQAQWADAADMVICDVPCSGLGIIRKKPDIRDKDPGQLAGLLPVQQAILANGSRYVKPGGLLLYSTCTILPEENEGITDAFLAEHPDFMLEPFTLPAPVGETDGHLTLWPQRHDTDGFYICCMRRRKKEAHD